MSVLAPSLTLGIEEEYLLVDLETRELVRDPPKEIMEVCRNELADQVTAEFLRSQIEVGTRICQDVHEAREDLIHLRSVVARTAREYGIAPIAASTHPAADWVQQITTPKDRYDELLRDLAGVARRMLICGMHVHAGIEDEELRIDLMNQVSYFLPHLLALSTSSPFWKGEDMGMMSYRMVVFDALPRTGLPPRFDSYTEYVAFVGQLVSAEVIDDATRIWWDARPSGRFPTLEARVFDVCTRLEDAICLAAIYQSLLRRLYRLRLDNQRWRAYPLAALDENRWRAMRYGTEGSLIDFGKGRVVPFEELVDELIEIIKDDADALGCLAEVEHAREIVQRGTSAHRQLHIYSAARQAGADEKEALYALVDHLIEETLEGFEEEAS